MMGSHSHTRTQINTVGWFATNDIRITHTHIHTHTHLLNIEANETNKRPI